MNCYQVHVTEYLHNVLLLAKVLTLMAATLATVGAPLLVFFKWVEGTRQWWEFFLAVVLGLLGSCALPILSRALGFPP